MLSITSLLFALALSSGILANPTPRQSPQISCEDITETIDANYMGLTNSTRGFAAPGFNSSYKLSDALAAVGSKSSAGDNPQVLHNADPFNGDSFRFLACASSYMKYPTTTNGTDNTLRYYGHITPTRDNSTCVTRTKVDDGHEFFTNSPCRYNDDAGQEAQYFQLKAAHVDPGQQDVHWNLTLLGHPQGNTGDKFYFSPGTDAAPAITVARNTPSDYQLSLDFVHIN